MQRLNLSDLPLRVKTLTKFRLPVPDWPDCVGYANVAIDNVATVYAVKIYKRDGKLSAELPCASTHILCFIAGIPVSDRKLGDRICEAVVNEWRETYED